MIARAIEPKDLIPLMNIHKEFYKDQFALPAIVDEHNLVVFTIANDRDKPIVVGIVRQIAELITVTDLSVPVGIRKEALFRALAITEIAARERNYDQIHAFVNDPHWANTLKKRAGFATCKGEALYLNV